MDFVDHRKKDAQPEQQKQQQPPRTARYRGQRYFDYVEEQIRQAQERGEFSNLRGEGKPLELDTYSSSDDRAMAHRILKNNDLVPLELALIKEIDQKKDQNEQRLQRLIHYGNDLRARRVPPSTSERSAYNKKLEQGLEEYEEELRKINSKILTLNLSTPATLHRPLIKVDEMVRQARRKCRFFAISSYQVVKE